jgi:hypothetical protein
MSSSRPDFGLGEEHLTNDFTDVRDLSIRIAPPKFPHAHLVEQKECQNSCIRLKARNAVTYAETGGTTKLKCVNQVDRN